MTWDLMLTGAKDLIIKFANIVLQFFPHSPLATVIEGIQNIPVLGWLNWFVPIDQMVVLGEGWLVAIGIMYTYKIFAKISKLM